MAGGCKAAIGCVDARVPVRASYVSLYKWPESDAEFVRSVAMARRHGEAPPPESPTVLQHYGGYYYNGSGSMRRGGAGGGAEGYCCPRVVDSYSCRQIYLRSYTFSKKKETVPERTMACLGRVRDRGAAVFPLFIPQRGGGGSDAGSVNSASSITREAAADAGGGRRGGSSRKGRRRRRRSKGCAMVRRLQEASCGAVRALFHRLLACTTSVEVADAGEPPSR